MLTTFPQSQLQLWPHRERDANAEYDEEKDAEAAEDEDRHRAPRLKSKYHRATTAGAAAAAATTVMRHDVWSQSVATGALWFATSRHRVHARRHYSVPHVHGARGPGVWRCAARVPAAAPL